LDEIISRNKSQRTYFDIDATAFSNAEQAFVYTLRQHVNFLKRVHNAKKKEVIWSMNTLLPVTCMRFDTLFKFFFYRYIKSMENVPFGFSLSDLSVPAEITSLCLEGKYYYYNLSKYCTYIYDDKMLFNIVKDIAYYRDMMLITDTELSLLKLELDESLALLTKVITNDMKEDYTEFPFYVSALSIPSCSIYYNFDGNQLSQIWMYPVNPIEIHSPAFCELHQRFLKTSLKYATLVTLSNEINQSYFLNKQHEYIALLTE
jgi:hypothetical protein